MTSLGFPNAAGGTATSQMRLPNQDAKFKQLEHVPGPGDSGRPLNGAEGTGASQENEPDRHERVCPGHDAQAKRRNRMTQQTSAPSKYSVRELADGLNQVCVPDTEANPTREH